MKWLVSVVALAVGLCNVPLLADDDADLGLTDFSLRSGGVNRTYHLHVPDSYEHGTEVALIIAYHGGQATGSDMVDLTGFNELADSEGFIVCYPDGVLRTWADGRGTTAADQAHVDDVTFTQQLINHIAEAYSIDRARVYATGISNGGFMSQRLASELPDHITAICSVAAAIPQNMADDWGSSPIPVMMINGTADPFVPFTGGEMTRGPGGTVLSHPECLAKWRVVDHITGTVEADTMSEPEHSTHKMFVERKKWEHGRDGSELISIVCHGAGHTWPGGPQYLPQAVVGAVCHDFNASEVMWEFFQQHVRE